MIQIFDPLNKTLKVGAVWEQSDRVYGHAGQIIKFDERNDEKFVIMIDIGNNQRFEVPLIPFLKLYKFTGIITELKQSEINLFDGIKWKR